MNPTPDTSRLRATRPASRLVRGAGADREGDFPMSYLPNPEDACDTCDGTGCADCGNTGYEIEAVRHGVRRRSHLVTSALEEDRREREAERSQLGIDA